MLIYDKTWLVDQVKSQIKQSMEGEITDNHPVFRNIEELVVKEMTELQKSRKPKKPTDTATALMSIGMGNVNKGESKPMDFSFAISFIAARVQSVYQRQMYIHEGSPTLQ